MRWFWNIFDSITTGHFDNGNIIEWRPDGWRLKNNPDFFNKKHSLYWEELTIEQIKNKEIFRATIQVIFENPEEVKKRWK